MQIEIDSQNAVPTIQILGVNGPGLESANGGMTAGRVLPWLQPTTDEDVWTLWHVEYRDVIILDPGNGPVGTFNLTVNDLSDPVNYASLKNRLLEFANE